MAQTSKQARKIVQFRDKDLPATAATYYQGSVVGWDTSVGRVVKGAASTTLIPIGLVVEDTVVASNGDPLKVKLFREIIAVWLKNHGSDTVVAADRGGLCYLDDENTVRKTDNTNANSVAGRVWDVDATKGVLVEPRDTSGDRLGGLDA